MTSTDRYERAAAALTKWNADLVRFAYAYLLNRSDAQDAVQDAFMSYMKHAPEFADESGEKAWLMRVTANRCKSLLRSGWFKSREPIPEDLPAEEPKKAVILALGRLPSKYRMPLHLHYYCGYSLKEMSGLLGAGEATLGTRLARGRELLRQELGGEEIED